MPAASEARALVAAARFAALATLDRETGGPFASLVAVAEDGGRPLLVLSGLAEHTKNLRVRPEASLLITGEAATSSMDRARVTLGGRVRWLAGAEATAATARFLAVNPEAKAWASLPGFQPCLLEVTSVRFVGGFARAAGITAADYFAAAS